MGDQPPEDSPAGDGQAGDGRALSATPPGPELIGLLRDTPGPAERYAAADDGTVVAAAGRWDAAESWCVSRKLAAIREMIRRRPAEGYEPGPAGAQDTSGNGRETSGSGPETSGSGRDISGNGRDTSEGGQPDAASGGLPDLWRKDLTEEVALELAISTAAADGLIGLAWALERRLPLTAAALDAGILNLSKARMIATETSVLSDADARAAEALVAPMWAGKTWGQIHARMMRAVVEVDPAGAQKRREQAEREEARVQFWREQAGTAALAGYGLPTDEALMAHQNLQARALAYKQHGIKQPMDLLRVMAMLDLLNGTDARTRYPGSAPAARPSWWVETAGNVPCLSPPATPTNGTPSSSARSASRS